MKPKLYLLKHSLADWDWEENMYRELTTAQFISPPSSLMLYTQAGAHEFNTALCRHPDTQCLAEGELGHWMRTQNKLYWVHFNFRNQCPLGNANWSNCYHLYFMYNQATLHRRINDTDTGIAYVPISIDKEMWYHFRVVWWNGQNLEGYPALAVELYQEIEGEWVKKGDTMFDTMNQWKDSSINRVGFTSRGNIVYVRYVDDTEIWRPA